MGAEREDTDPTPLKGGTEPGLGPKRPNGAAAQPPPVPANASAKQPREPVKEAAKPPPPPPPQEEPAPVDFDALHAALGDLPQQSGSIPPKVVGDSEGRSSATYASARPHTIPPTLEPSDLDAPPVIVATEDTVPSAPPQMTTPIAPASAQATPSPSGNHSASHPQSDRERTGQPTSSGNQPVAKPQPSYPFTPQPFPVQRGIAQPTMKMPDRPRRPRSPTVVVRPRGPSKVQKLIVFAAMLVLFLAFALAVAIWRQPSWFGLEPPAPAVTLTVHPPATVVPTMTASVATPATTTTTAPLASTSTPTPSVSASASSKVIPKKPPFGK